MILSTGVSASVSGSFCSVVVFVCLFRNLGVEYVRILCAVQVGVYWLVTYVYVFYWKFLFEEFQSDTVNTLCFECSYLPYDVVTVGQHFHYFERAFPVKGLELFLANLGVMYGVKQEDKVVHFKWLCFGFSVIVSFVLWVCSYYIVCVVSINFVHAV